MGASESKPEIKIILAGKTGVGKSSTGNTILKKEIFPSESSPISKTKDSATGDGMVNDRRITVIDTPGIFDTSDDEKNIKEKLIRALVDCAPGPSVLVFVLKVERYTLQEREIETKIWEYFKDINVKQSLVLFTHGEQLEGQTIEEFVKKSPRLQEYVKKCEGRCHVIDSKYWKNSWWGYKSNRFQVKNLLDTIDKMRKENECYTNELLQIVDEEIKKEIVLTDPNLSQQERREKAKNNVFEKLCIRFAGVATGTLVGAVMGIAVPVATLVALVKGVKNVSATFTDSKMETAEGAEFKTSSACTLTEELDEATAGETRVTAAAVFGATAAAAVGTSASVSAIAAVDAIVAAGAAGATAGAAASVGAAAAVGAASAGATAAVGAAAAGATVGAASAAGATAAAASVGAAVAVEAGVAAGAAAGATAAGGAVAVEAGVAAGASIGAAAGSGIAVGVVFGAAALAGAIGGGITGYKAVDNADSVLDAIKIAVNANYENLKEVVKKAEELPTKIHMKLGRRIQEGRSSEFLLSEENDK